MLNLTLFMRIYYNLIRDLLRFKPHLLHFMLNLYVLSPFLLPINT